MEKLLIVGKLVSHTLTKARLANALPKRPANTLFYKKCNYSMLAYVTPTSQDMIPAIIWKAAEGVVA